LPANTNIDSHRADRALAIARKISALRATVPLDARLLSAASKAEDAAQRFCVDSRALAAFRYVPPPSWLPMEPTAVDASQCAT
jgi:hypothetical protein